MFLKRVILLLLLTGNGTNAIRHRKHLSFLDPEVDENEMEVLLRMKNLRMSMMVASPSTTVTEAFPTSASTASASASPTPATTAYTTSASPTPATNAYTASASPTPATSFVCNLSPQQRAFKFRQMAIQVAGTSAATLNNENSPQAKALKWISHKDQISPPLCPSDEQDALQRYIMAAFYFSTGGSKWKECKAPTDSSPAAIAVANQNCSIEATKYPMGDRKYGTDAWLMPTPVCDWAGLVCHIDDERRGTLDQIDFEHNNLSGMLIDEIGLLKNLRFLILEQGSIEGEIPESIGKLRLLILDLDFNRLVGQIPPSLYNVKSLLQLDLNDNQMTGQLKSDVGNWQNMTYLQLNHNAFTGIIPSELGQLKKLREYSFPLRPATLSFTRLTNNTTCLLKQITHSSTAMALLEVYLNQYAIIASQRAENSRLWKQTVLDRDLRLLVIQNVALPAPSEWQIEIGDSVV